MTVYHILLFTLTFIGGSLPIWVKKISERAMQLLLAFSGAFLLSITLLHLLPETFEEIGHKAGFLLLVGFFIQLLIQRFTHGAEHGHTHAHHHHDHKSLSIASIMLGLSVHAFMEGLPLGFNYRLQATEPSLFLAVAAHKIPEAIIVTSLLLQAGYSKSKAIFPLAVFAAITPLSGIIATELGVNYLFITELVSSFIPIVAGAFIHISTTIFFESGTKNHMLTWRKTVAILLGVGIGILTLLFEH